MINDFGPVELIVLNKRRTQTIEKLDTFDYFRFMQHKYYSHFPEEKVFFQMM